MSDTIFYKGKLKRGREPIEAFEKINKGIKKKGPTKNWKCTIDEDEEYLCIDFQDGESETFFLQFDEKGRFDDFCKVCFPLEGDLYEDGKSEFKALLDIIYKAKSVFSSIQVTDDYGLAESYWDGKRFKFDLRNLTSEEEDRARNLYNQGNTTHEQILMAIMAEDMEMSVEELMEYRNIDIDYSDELFPKIHYALKNYLYETAEYKNDGRLCDMSGQEYYGLGAVGFSEFAFIMGISWIFFDGTGSGTSISLEKGRAFSPKDAQVGVVFRERFAPLFIKEKDPFERCILAYRYFVSVYDYLGFRYVGRCRTLKTCEEEILEEYGDEKGNIFLTCYCTTIKHISNRDILIKNMQERYGEKLFSEYMMFKKKYQGNMKFIHETKYFERKYIDDSLIS